MSERQPKADRRNRADASEVNERPGEDAFCEAMFGGIKVNEHGELHEDGDGSGGAAAQRDMASRLSEKSDRPEIEEQRVRLTQSYTHSRGPMVTERRQAAASVFEKPTATTTRAVPTRAEPSQKPKHYKVVSISLYNEDIERLNSMVTELKSRGHYKANKSQIIRYALANLDLDQIPRTF